MRRAADLCRKYGMSEATLYNWKAKYGGLDVSEAKRLKALEDENAKLKRLLADAMLDAAALKGAAGKKMVGPAAKLRLPPKREAVAHLRTLFEMSERRATTLVGADRTMIRYRSRRPDDAALRGAPARSRPSAPSLRLSLSRQAIALQLPKGGGSTCCCGATARRRAATRSIGCIAPKVSRCASVRVSRRAVGASGRRSRSPLLPNMRWSLDFVHDQLACGRRFRILNVVDDATRECLLAVADTSISGKRVARELTALMARRDPPAGMIVSDNGTEFTSNAVLAWCEAEGDRLALHRTGQADAERLLRELQRPHARRALERDAVPGSSPRSREARDMGHRLQHRAASLGARLPHTGGASRAPHRNGRSAAQPRPAPPTARCSIRARRRINQAGSNRGWMRVRGQVTATAPAGTSQTH